MDFTTFVRKPFVVEAVEITPDNIAEVAKHVGDLREKEDGTQYILVDRRLVPNVFRVYSGYYMTKMNENVRCYSRKIFREQFIEQDDTIKPWVDFLNKDYHGLDAPQPHPVDPVPGDQPMLGEYGRIINQD
jgi:hypothetical protein